MDLSLKERRILHELDQNSSQSSAQIAKKVKLSKSTTHYIITNLEQNIIKQYNTVIDTGKLGLIGFRLYLKTQGTTLEKEEEIINFLRSQPNVTWLVSIEGDYTLGAFIAVKNIEDMAEIWKELLNKYTSYIEDHILVVMNKITYLTRAYLLETKQKKETIFVTPPQPSTISDIDKKILNLLAANARIPIIELAKKLKTTPKTIISHINTLEKKEIIIGYKTVFDLEKLGYHHYKYLLKLQNCTLQKQKEIKAYLKANTYTVYDVEVIGGCDIEIELEVPNTETLRIFIDNFKKEYGAYIKDYKKLYYYKEHKYVYLPENY